jgi:hypothetical protein
MADLNTDQEFAGVVLAITDSRGRPATVDGAPVWSSSDETVVSVVATADGMGATISSVAPGTARVSVQADADLGEGSTPVTGVTEDIVVTQAGPGAAAVLKLTLGAATDKA